MRLVPFGEYIPARSLLGWATSVGKAAGEDRKRGTEQVVMDVGHGLRIGPVVCFESAFPDMSRHLAPGRRPGARRPVLDLVVPAQLGARAARLARGAAGRRDRPAHGARHADRRLRRLRPEGERVGAAMGTDTSSAQLTEVPLATGRTLYVRLGDWTLWLALTALAAYGVVEGARAAKRRWAQERAEFSATVPAGRRGRVRTARGCAGRPAR